MKTFRSTSLLVLTGLLLGLAGPVLSAPTSESAAAPTLTKVESRKVCMVNDTFFPRDQIPVEVEGRTYYGCCEMCKGRLAKDSAIRQAVDPVTGGKVDKATALIAAGPDGRVLYFENQESFSRYGSKP